MFSVVVSVVIVYFHYLLICSLQGTFVFEPTVQKQEKQLIVTIKKLESATLPEKCLKL